MQHSRTLVRFVCALLGGFFLLPSANAQALAHPYFSKHPQQEKQLEVLLKQAQLQALEPQPADLSVPLEDLQGKKVSLSQHRGKVLLLGRWATW